ncbi:MAG: right-handed parallel beta-helix repeat-containing protein, partial [Acidimicrobiales bacterium]
MVDATANTAYGSLQDAVAGATTGDALEVFGTCTGTTTISTNLTITGQAANGFTAPTLDGGSVDNSVTNSVLTISSGATVAIGNLMITDGNAAWGGGGILNFGSVTVTGSTISNNTASGGWGGGGILNDGSLTVTGSTISNNTATDAQGCTVDQTCIGGGIFNYPGNSVTVTGSTISNNSAGTQGGGIFQGEGPMAVTDSTISNNSAGSYGGGIYNDTTVTVTGSTISNNTSGYIGGGIYNDDGGAPTVTDSTISGNYAASEGGGIYLNLTTMTVTTSTISGNTAGGSGGGIYNYESSLIIVSSTISGTSGGGGIYNYSDTYPGSVSIAGTIVATNGANCAGTAITDDGYNLEDDAAASCGFSTASHDVVGQSPDLGTLANNGGPTETMALLPGSPAIDAIPNPTTVSIGTLCAGTDQRGVSRKTPMCDIGAYDTVNQAPSFSASANPTSTAYGNTVSLSAAGLPSGATGTVSFTSSGSTLCS